MKLGYFLVLNGEPLKYVVETTDPYNSATEAHTEAKSHGLRDNEYTVVLVNEQLLNKSTMN